MSYVLLTEGNYLSPDAPTLPCNPVNMRKWITALRSGDFSQTTGVLTRLIAQQLDGRGVIPGLRPAGSCCLGVVCEIANGDGVTLARVESMINSSEQQRGIVTYSVPGRYESYAPGSNSFEVYPPKEVAEWLGLHSRNGSGDNFGYEENHGGGDVNPIVAFAFTPHQGVGWRSVRASRANDSLGWSFDDIATALEHTYLRGQ